MRYVIAIDVGIKNLSVCVFDFRSTQIVRWETLSLVSNGRYIPSQNVRYVRDLVHALKEYFDAAFQVLIERQMRCNMRIIESVIQSMFYDVTIVISARSIKMHYHIGCNNYRANKQKAVKWAREFCLHNPHAFATDIARVLARSKKADDLADSLLLLLYYLDTYSNQLDETLQWETPILHVDED